MLKIYLVSLPIAGYLVFFHGFAWAAQLCVDPGGGGDYTGIQEALDAAKDNEIDDTVKVVQGTYNGNYQYYSAKGHNITIEGGYTPECAIRELDPENTVLDGGNSDRVLVVDDADGGDIVLDGFSVRNGNAALMGGGILAKSASTTVAGSVTLINNLISGNSTGNNGGGIYAFSSSDAGTAGTVTISNNIIIDNSGTGQYTCGGGVLARSYSPSGTAGNVVLINNTVTGNSTTGTDSSGGGVCANSYSINGAAGTVTLTNNTVVSNTAVLEGGGLDMYASSSANSSGIVNCYNNIIRGNTSPTGADIKLHAGGTKNGYNNNYSALSGTWDGSGGNIDADSLFVDPGCGDYHLLSGSPCIDAGENTAPLLPDSDFEGDQRKIDGDWDGTITVDMGVDEFNPGLKPFFWPLFLPAITGPRD